MSKIGFTKEQWFKNYFPSCRSWLNMFKLCGVFGGKRVDVLNCTDKI